MQHWDFTVIDSWHLHYMCVFYYMSQKELLDCAVQFFFLKSNTDMRK